MSNSDKKQLVKLLSYMSTFDGGLYKSSNSSNARFVMNIRKENMDYAEWTRDTLLEVTGASVKERQLTNADGCNRKPQVRVESQSHPFLTKLHSRIYMTGSDGRYHKVIDPHMLHLMDAEALAIIFMTDGGTSIDTRNPKAHPKVTLNTKGFSYADNMSLSKAIYGALGIRTNVHRHRQYFYLSVKTADVQKFVDCVKPHVMPSFRYKLERLAPSWVVI